MRQRLQLMTQLMPSAVVYNQNYSQPVNCLTSN